MYPNYQQGKKEAPRGASNHFNVGDPNEIYDDVYGT